MVDLGQVIEFFNNAAADLPDPARLKGRKLPSMSVVLDGKGGTFAHVFEPRNRRVWVPLAKIPDVVQKPFIAAEDWRFFQHHGVDERGIIMLIKRDPVASVSEQIGEHGLASLDRLPPKVLALEFDQIEAQSTAA